MKKQNFHNSIKLVLFLIVFPLYCFSQKQQDSLLNIWINTNNYDDVRADAYNKYINTYYVTKKTDSAYAAVKELYDFTQKKNLKKQEADVIITEGYIYFYLGDFITALNLYKKALLIYEKLNHTEGIAKTLSNIGSIYSNEFNFKESLNYYKESLELYESIKDTSNIAKTLIFIGNTYSNQYKLDKASQYFNKGLEYVTIANDLQLEALIYMRFADNFKRQENYTEAQKFYFKSLEISRKINDLNAERNTLFSLSVVFKKNKNYDNCIIYGKKSLAIAKEIGDNMYSVATNYNISDAYKAKNQISLAFKYLETATSLESQIKQFSATQLLQKLEIEKIKFKDSIVQIEKNTNTKLVHEQEINKKNKENRRLTLAWGLSLTAVSICAFLIFRTAKRKQRKAEKERQQQIAEKEKLLKDLELSTIDAMIEGQEKERQRLAEDLHDSVGATLSAAKMQFDYLVKNKNNTEISETLIKKTSSLLEDAYAEVRAMAHLKNSGVIAKNGLLPAVERLTKNASSINELTFEVQSSGLEQRLDNSLEISIFRIVQELVTNIIKHSNATNSTIHLTNYDKNLNIMVEDNGIGFNQEKSKTGMGLSNIEKRVTYLKGKLTIESKKNRGSTVIIDIPI